MPDAAQNPKNMPFIVDICFFPPSGLEYIIDGVVLTVLSFFGKRNFRSVEVLEERLVKRIIFFPFWCTMINIKPNKEHRNTFFFGGGGILVKTKKREANP